VNCIDARLVGITFVVPTVIGLVGGYWLDRWLGTAPWLAMIGLGLGIVAGFANLFRSAKRR
jgi:ATP synthase protein I